MKGKPRQTYIRRSCQCPPAAGSATSPVTACPAQSPRLPGRALPPPSRAAAAGTPRGHPGDTLGTGSKRSLSAPPASRASGAGPGLTPRGYFRNDCDCDGTTSSVRICTGRGRDLTVRGWGDPTSRAARVPAGSHSVSTSAERGPKGPLSHRTVATLREVVHVPRQRGAWATGGAPEGPTSPSVAFASQGKEKMEAKRRSARGCESTTADAGAARPALRAPHTDPTPLPGPVWAETGTSRPGR